MSITNIYKLTIDHISATVDFSNITITYDFYSNDELCFTIQKPFKSISFMMWEFISNNFMSYSVAIKGEPYILNEAMIYKSLQENKSTLRDTIKS